MRPIARRDVLTRLTGTLCSVGVLSQAAHWWLVFHGRDGSALDKTLVLVGAVAILAGAIIVMRRIPWSR